MAKACLTLTYLFFYGKYYDQTVGAAMRSTLFPVAANLYMRNLKETAVKKP